MSLFTASSKTYWKVNELVSFTRTPPGGSLMVCMLRTSFHHLKMAALKIPPINLSDIPFSSNSLYLI